jgi:hypothetical protein
MSSNPLLSRGTRLLANERKLTVVPSPLIDGTRLLPLDAVDGVPAPSVTRTVLTEHSTGATVDVVTQVLFTKIFSTPFVVLAKLDEVDAKAMYWPVLLILGNSLFPFPGIPLFVVEISVVEGVQVVVMSKHVSRI